MTTTLVPETAETITLKGGTVVSLPALQVLWDLEARGFDICVAEDGRILVGPNARLDDHDRTNIRQHKAELIQLVRYCEAIQ